MKDQRAPVPERRHWGTHHDTLARTAALFAFAAAAPLIHADVIISNINDSIDNFSQLGDDEMKAIGFTTAPVAKRFERAHVILTHAAGGTHTIIGGIHEDDGGDPGALLAGFESVTLEPGDSMQSFTLTTRQVFVLEPNTTYWLQLDSDAPGSFDVEWEANSVPNYGTSNGTTFAGARFTSTGGTIWNNSSINNLTEVVTADLPAIANLPANAFDAVTQIGDSFTKAVGVMIGDDPVCFDRMAVTLSNSSGSAQTISGGIFEDSAGDPGALLAAFEPVALAAGTAPPTETVFTTAQPTVLDANTTYRFRLSGPAGVTSIRWPRPIPSAAPVATGDFTFAGYRFSTIDGAAWSGSTVFNGVSVLMAPAPILANLPGDGATSGGSSLGDNSAGFDGLKAVGITTSDMPLGCIEFSALIRNENATETLDLFGSITTDSAGNPGTPIANLRPAPIGPNAPNTIVTLVLEDPFFRLEPNTSYWFVLDGTDSDILINWSVLSPGASPSPAAGYTFNGYRFSSSGGAAWSNSGISNAMSLKASAICAADLDGNGVLNLDDLDTFVAAFLGADLLADIDGNGVLNLDDLDAFVASFLAGCG